MATAIVRQAASPTKVRRFIRAGGGDGTRSRASGRLVKINRWRDNGETRGRF